MSESTMLETVREWVNEAEVLTIDFLNKVFEGINDELKRAEESDYALVKRVEAIKKSFIPPKVAAFRSWREGLNLRVGEIIDKEKALYSSSPKFATVRDPGWKFYKTLMSNWDDLTSWTRTADPMKKLRERVKLEKLNMYPILFSDTGIMGFARIGSTRITYIRESVERNRVTIGNFMYVVELKFPKVENRSSNVILILQKMGSYHFVMHIELIFDGENITYVSDNFDELINLQKSTSPLDQDRFERNKIPFAEIFALRHNSNGIHALLADATKPFRYSNIGTQNHNIEEYAGGTNYRIGLVQSSGLTCLVAQCVDIKYGPSPEFDLVDLGDELYERD
jgi:protein associated with RNAse G/E